MFAATQSEEAQKGRRAVVELEEIVVRFCGDSGDGMQLAGTQMTNTSAVFGNEVSTLPDFPAEIRAPLGSLASVSCFQVNFGAHKLRTPGDRVHALIAMNPAALKTSIDDVEPGGVVIANRDAFGEQNLTKAGYSEDPLESGEFERYRVFKVPISKLTAEACANIRAANDPRRRAIHNGPSRSAKKTLRLTQVKASKHNLSDHRVCWRCGVWAALKLAEGR